MAKHWFSVLNGIVLAFILLACIFPGVLTTADPNQINFAEKLDPPSPDHWMGTDEMGRDVFARVLCGGRVTLLSALIIAAGSLVIALFWAGCSVYLGGKVDETMTRFVDILMNLPNLLLALILVSILDPGMPGLVLALTLIGWTGNARILRGQMISIMSAEYITAAESIGGGMFWIIRKHLLPNTRHLTVTLLGLNFASSVLSIASLNFLGFGVKLPNAEWGAMINTARPFLQTHPYLTLYPGLAIALSVLAAHFAFERVEKGGINYL
jgi:peptide/nickel transport system permease protein